jgi:hypothetical protein
MYAAYPTQFNLLKFIVTLSWINSARSAKTAKGNRKGSKLKLVTFKLI